MSRMQIHMRTLGRGAFAAIAVTLVACGSSAAVTATSVSGAPASTAAATGAVTTAQSSSGTTAATADLSTATKYVDPQGHYTLPIDPTWQDVTGSPQIPSKEIEGWLVGPTVDGIAANVNVVTEQASGSHGAYVDADAYGAGNEFVTLLEYSGAVKGAANDRPVHFLAFITKHGTQVAIATLTASESDFATRRQQISPYLERLRAT
jgi:hypothetical protein